MKYYKLLVFFLVLVQTVSAQQITFYNQYLQNQSLYNPAAAATKNYLDVKFFHRQQWAGWEGAPVNYYAHLNSPVREKYRKIKALPQKYHGLSFTIHYERAGIFQQSQVQIGYQYHLTLWKNMDNFLRLAVGASFGVHTIGFDQATIRLTNPNDPLLAEGAINSLTVDGNLGIWLYSKNFYGGLSALNFAENKFGFGSENRLKRHYSLSMGWKWELQPEVWAFVPSVMVLTTDLNHYLLNFSGCLRFEDKIWFGTSYAPTHSVSLYIGFNIRQIMDFTYSYENFFSQKNPIPSQEITLGFKIGNYRYRSRSKPEIPLFD